MNLTITSCKLKPWKLVFIITIIEIFSVCWSAHEFLNTILKVVQSFMYNAIYKKVYECMKYSYTYTHIVYTFWA